MASAQRRANAFANEAIASHAVLHMQHAHHRSPFLKKESVRALRAGRRTALASHGAMMTERRAKHIIDMRARPSFLHSFFGADCQSDDYETVRWINSRLGARDVDHFTRAKDLTGLVEELAAAHIDVAVMVGRSTPAVRISNDELAALVGASEGRLLGVGSVDPQLFAGGAAEVEAYRCLSDLKLAGVNVDPGFYNEPISHDHESLTPIYAACDAANKPVFLMSGPTTPDLRHNDPLAVDRVAKRFPSLRIVCCHGFYPRIDDMIGVAFRNENVFVSPDMYLFAPGGERYAAAAKGFLSTQLLFGTSYPFRPILQSVKDFFALELDEDALENVAWRNAARLLHINLN
ncbi:amidohydrolase family protein [Methylocystis suflitae]|uniref:amidohydrolase family protein n=1 Tax=Methylocystis suflitae TaxID=2951405 RepID=UPI00210961A8|nr:amidohydrolase family protein [Methylocystis suflitae]MCQ4191600.1 amidohydrolase family protein [Methylocystis suflitae]